MYTIDTTNHSEQVKSFISELQNWFDKGDLYDGLSNQDILEYHYDERIYQFGNYPLDSYDIKTIISNSNGKYRVYLHFRNDKSFNIGTINGNENLNDYLNNECYEPRIYIRGGRYKKVVINEDGADRIKSFREPYIFQIGFLKKKKPKDINYINDTTNQQVLGNNKWQQISQKTEKIGNSMQSAGNNMAGCGCLIILLVTIPVIILLCLIF